MRTIDSRLIGAAAMATAALWAGTTGQAQATQQPVQRTVQHTAQQPVRPAATAIAGGSHAGDFNHDGRQDLLTVRDFQDGGGPVLDCHERVDTGSGYEYGATELTRGVGGLRWFGAGDYNRDGAADLAVLTGAGELRISLNTGNYSSGKTLGPFRTVLTGLGNRDLIFTGDADGDGFEDVFARRTGTNTTDVYRNTAAATVAFAAPKPYLSTASGVVRQLAADVTGDGRQDVLSVTSAGQLHLRDIATGASYLLGGGWQTVHDLLLSDHNGDGRPDLLGRRTGFPDRIIAFPHATAFDPAHPAGTFEPPSTVYYASPDHLPPPVAIG